MAKKKVAFEAFLDGICSFWQLDEHRMPVPLLANVRFKRRTVGARRNYDAEQNGHNVEMLIRIPRADFICRGTFVVIGSEQYRVLQSQTILDTIPQCTDLTLEQPETLAEFDEKAVGAGGRV